MGEKSEGGWWKAGGQCHWMEADNEEKRKNKKASKASESNQKLI